MAIQFARIRVVGRSKGFNACQRASYNANITIKDNRINKTFYFKGNITNVYHLILLPSFVHINYKLASKLMNEVERCEKKRNSQLLKEYVLALPDEVEISLDNRIELTLRFVEKMNFINNGLGVQVDIHQPVEGESNWYAKILVTTRRFTKDGMALGEKARDLEIQVRKSKGRSFVPNQVKDDIGEIWGEIQNNYFQELGLSLRVKEVKEISDEHIGVKKYGIIAEQNRFLKQLNKDQL
jgi:hypothetical protein